MWTPAKIKYRLWEEQGGQQEPWHLRPLHYRVRLWALLSWRGCWQHLLCYYRIDVFYKMKSEIATSQLDKTCDKRHWAITSKVQGPRRMCAVLPAPSLGFESDCVIICSWSQERVSCISSFLPRMWFRLGGEHVGAIAPWEDSLCRFHSNLINISKHLSESCSHKNKQLWSIFSQFSEKRTVDTQGRECADYKKRKKWID